MVSQAECMAHYLHSKMREGYYIEMASGKGKKDKDKAGINSLNDLMAAMKSGKQIPGVEVIRLPKPGGP